MQPASFNETQIVSETSPQDPGETPLGRSENPGPTPASAPTMRTDSLFHRPETPVAIARQLSEQALNAQSRTVELHLNPEELGRVQMSLASGDDAIVVSIATERPETLTLMRRHIEQLSLEFQRIGYSNVSFSFESQGGSSGSGQQPDKGTPPVNIAAEDTPSATQTARQSVPHTGLDIRI